MSLHRSNPWRAVGDTITSGTLVGFGVVVVALTIVFGATSVVSDYWNNPKPLPERPFYLVSPGPSIHVPYLMEVPPIVEPVRKHKRGRRS